MKKEYKHLRSSFLVEENSDYDDNGNVIRLLYTGYMSKQPVKGAIKNVMIISNKTALKVKTHHSTFYKPALESLQANEKHLLNEIERYRNLIPTFEGRLVDAIDAGWKTDTAMIAETISDLNANHSIVERYQESWHENKTKMGRIFMRQLDVAKKTMRTSAKIQPMGIQVRVVDYEYSKKDKIYMVMFEPAELAWKSIDKIMSNAEKRYTRRMKRAAKYIGKIDLLKTGEMNEEVNRKIRNYMEICRQIDPSLFPIEKKVKTKIIEGLSTKATPVATLISQDEEE